MAVEYDLTETYDALEHERLRRARRPNLYSTTDYSDLVQSHERLLILVRDTVFALVNPPDSQNREGSTGSPVADAEAKLAIVKDTLVEFEFDWEANGLADPEAQARALMRICKDLVSTVETLLGAFR